MKISKKRAEDWEARKRDTEIRDLLRRVSSKPESEHPVRLLGQTGQSVIQAEVAEGSTVDELLEGSLNSK
jgi:hypothetical protein